MNSNSTTGHDILCILSGFLALLCLGLSYAWSVFRGPFSLLFPDWTEVQLSLIFSCSMIFFGVGSFLSGWLAKRISLGRLLLLGSGMVVLGLGSCALCTPIYPRLSYSTVLFMYGLVCGSGIGMCYNAINSSIPRFYKKRRGILSGLLMTGYGSGALLLGMIASRLIALPSVGLSGSFLILSAGMLLVLLLSVHCFNKKEFATTRHTLSLSQAKVMVGYSPKEVLHLPAFWLLQLRNIFSYAACLIVIENATGFGQYLSVAGSISMLITVFNGVGRIPAGLLCDQRGPLFALRSGNVLITAGALLLILSLSKELAPLLLLSFIFLGTGYGFTPPVSVVANDVFFGEKHRSSNYAFFSFSLAPASLLGPSLSGLLQGIGGNSFPPSLILVGVYSLLALVLSFLLKVPPKKKTVEEPLIP